MFKALSIADRLMLYKTLDNMLNARLSVSDAFANMLAVATRKDKQSAMSRRLIQCMQHTISAMNAQYSLSVALTNYIPKSENIILRAAEDANNLQGALLNLVSLIQTKQTAFEIIITTITMPILVIFTGFVVVTMFGVLVVPTLIDVVDQTKISLVTKGFVGLSAVLKNWWIVFLMIPIVLSAWFVWSLQNWTTSARTFFDKFAPYSIYRLLEGISVMRAYQILLGTNISSADAIQLLSVNANPYVTSRLTAVARSVRLGAGLGVAFNDAKLGFPDAVHIDTLLLIPADGRIAINIDYATNLWVATALQTMREKSGVLKLVLFIGVASMTFILYYCVYDLSNALAVSVDQLVR